MEENELKNYFILSFQGKQTREISAPDLNPASVFFFFLPLGGTNITLTAKREHKKDANHFVLLCGMQSR